MLARLTLICLHALTSCLRLPFLYQRWADFRRQRYNVFIAGWAEPNVMERFIPSSCRVLLHNILVGVAKCRVLAPVGWCSQDACNITLPPERRDLSALWQSALRSMIR